ncbi:hypothetical protein NL676_004524 [Syzygium grande]|nr:hypothetical protein NL676_004524 [Syzygium grande]
MFPINSSSVLHDPYTITPSSPRQAPALPRPHEAEHHTAVASSMTPAFCHDKLAVSFAEPRSSSPTPNFVEISIDEAASSSLHLLSLVTHIFASIRRRFRRESMIYCWTLLLVLVRCWRRRSCCQTDQCGYGFKIAALFSLATKSEGGRGSDKAGGD